MHEEGTATGFKQFVDANRNITTIHTDATPRQMQLMGEGYVDGLVGQLPYQMGMAAMEILLQVMEGIPPKQKIYGTHLIEILSVPQVLPEVNVDMNYIGRLAIVGYTLFALLATGSLGFAAWTFVNRNTRVVRASQPIFLGTICLGTFILGSTIIPMTIDDEETSHWGCNLACRCIPWLLTIGFSTIFCALFSKTWRANKLFHHRCRFQRMKVTEKDVIVPTVVIMPCNVIVLVCWTVFAPREYIRKAYPGTEGWNRVISTYGSCTGSVTAHAGSYPYFAILLIVNITLLVVANFQAYQARSIHTDFSESRYIAIIMASILQTFVVTIPMTILTWDYPKAKYIYPCRHRFIHLVHCSARFYVRPEGNLSL